MYKVSHPKLLNDKYFLTYGEAVAFANALKIPVSCVKSVH